jgi:hypothetical protein
MLPGITNGCFLPVTVCLSKIAPYGDNLKIS